jgi:glucose-1-phosphate cytidylyltransferase
MKVVILAGGLGTRLAEETEIRPKPMVEIGGRPIIWHIMKHYAHYGFNEFVLALGYKGEDVKRYFLDYYRLNGNVSIDLGTGHVDVSHEQPSDWNVHLVDTGQQTNTGGRVRRLRSLLGDEPFMLTYGDGVCDLNLRELLTFHDANRCVATITAVRPPARFGGLLFNGDRVSSFTEKPQVGEGWINGGFMVFEPKIFEYLRDDQTSLEADALEQLATDGKLVAYRHDRFWQCMDTLRDVRLLERLWQTGKAPWSTWD